MTTSTDQRTSTNQIGKGFAWLFGFALIVGAIGNVTGESDVMAATGPLVPEVKGFFQSWAIADALSFDSKMPDFITGMITVMPWIIFPGTSVLMLLFGAFTGSDDLYTAAAPPFGLLAAAWVLTWAIYSDAHEHGVEYPPTLTFIGNSYGVLEHGPHDVVCASIRGAMLLRPNAPPASLGEAASIYVRWGCDPTTLREMARDSGQWNPDGLRAVLWATHAPALPVDVAGTAV